MTSALPLLIPLADQPARTGGNPLFMLLPILLVVGLLFFMSRNQRKRVQQQSNMVSALKPGTKIITTSGMVGTFVRYEGDDNVVVEPSPGMEMTFVKRAIMQTAPDETATATDSADDPDRTDGTADGVDATDVAVDRPETADPVPGDTDSDADRSVDTGRGTTKADRDSGSAAI